MPGGASRLRTRIRSSGVPGSSPRSRHRYPRAFWYPVNGSVTARTWVSHFTLAIPYQPGTMSRTGKPWAGGSGSPFIRNASTTSSRCASATGSARA